MVNSFIDIIKKMNELNFKAIVWDRYEVTFYREVMGEPFSVREFTVDTPTRTTMEEIEDYCWENDMVGFNFELTTTGD
jgi:hypothetical protein